MTPTPRSSVLTTTVVGERIVGDGSALLTRAVQLTTGLRDATPREGQDALHRSIVQVMEDRTGHHAGQAPTGSGKSYAALAAAYLAAINAAERTVISTDSLALMAQLEDKDVPLMGTAAEELYPERPVSVAFLKGVANYIDPAKVLSTAQQITGTHLMDYGELAKAIRKSPAAATGVDQFPQIDPVQLADWRELVAWACDQYDRDDPNEKGDRHACPIEHTPSMWDTVSASSSEADDGSRIGVHAKATLSRLRAGEADVVITNHSILAVQAARAVPIIVGSAKLGEIDHIIVDEAHTLPSHVRSQGAAKLSGGVLNRLARKVTRAAQNSSTAILWRDRGDLLAEELDRLLTNFVGESRDGVRRVTDVSPVAEMEERLRAWLQTGRDVIGKRDQDNDPTIRVRASAALDSLNELRNVLDQLGRSRTGWGRWVERDSVQEGSNHRAWWSAHVSPIDVGFLLRDNLWGYDIPSSHDDDEVERKWLSVSAMSATMQSNYPFQAGMICQLVKFPSPFTDAYDQSVLFIPRVNSGPVFERITVPGYGNRRRFDVRAHALWASEQIISLVRANGGSALVLSATARDGKTYAQELRRALPGVTVHSQWDGGSATRIVSEWRDDVGSVLVGTKTMMTGVDAPGETCTLVVVDRVPRSPGNPLDEARVESIHARIENMPEAQRAVYAVDAALLLQQAVGRLIRSTGDRGTVAVLDPRMLKSTRAEPSPLAYPEPTRLTYMEAVRAFGRKMTRLEDVLEAIGERRR